MILIWGWRARKKTLGEGVFFCPRDQGDRNYRHRSARRWFTFFFIPLIPLNDLGDFVECESCKSTFYPNVLSAKTNTQIEDVLTIGLRYLVVAMIAADGVVDPNEKQAALAVMQRYANRPYDLSSLEADLHTLQPSEMTDKLEELGSILNEHGKEGIITACVQLAASDGSVDESELAVVRQAGQALTMSAAHVRGIIDNTIDSLRTH